MTHHNGRPALWQKARRTVGHHSGMKRLFLQTYVFAVCIPPETKKLHLQNVRVDQKKRLLWGFILLLFFKSTSPPHLCRTLSLLSLSLSRTHLFHRHPQRNNDDANIHTAYCNDSSSSSSVSSSKKVRVLPNGETISVDGTHLGHNLPDGTGNRYCINLVCVAGSPK